MRTIGYCIALSLALFACKKQAARADAGKPAAAPAGPRAVLETNHGEIEIELYADKAPKGVANFLKYAESGFYNGTIFHRVVRGFVVQGGGFDVDMNKRPTLPPIPNEADNGLANDLWTVAYARTPDPHSATSQFFINLRQNPALDHQGKTAQGWGYAVFGRVVRGMDAVDKIGNLPVGLKGGHPTVPTEPAIVQKVRIIRSGSAPK
jgi:cyclophilin family peptidyl-prolyl cis-trans isomerase